MRNRTAPARAAALYASSIHFPLFGSIGQTVQQLCSGIGFVFGKVLDLLQSGLGSSFHFLRALHQQASGVSRLREIRSAQHITRSASSVLRSVNSLRWKRRGWCGRSRQRGELLKLLDYGIDRVRLNLSVGISSER